MFNGIARRIGKGMSDNRTRDRSTWLAFLSIGLACLTVSAALYQNYIYTQLLDVIQRNVSRAEYSRACRDVIEAYFQVKLRVGLVLAEPPSAAGMLDVEAANAVSRVGAYGTYLANYRDEDVRYQYTQLTLELQRIVLAARTAGERDLDRLFGKADDLFARMNDDCVKTAKAAPL
jgi:hypothetical protein